MPQNHPAADPTYQIPKTAPDKKRILIIAAVVGGILVAVVAGLSVWAGIAGATYPKQAAAYQQNLQAAYRGTEPTFLAMQGADNPVDKANLMQEAQAKLEDALKTKPAEPKVMWISVAPAQDLQRVNDMTAGFINLVGAIQIARDFIAYETGLQEVLKQINASISDGDTQKAADAWPDIMTKLKALKPTPDAQVTHDTLVSDFDTAGKFLKEASDAKTQDYLMYLTKLSESRQKLANTNTPIGSLLDLLQNDVTNIYKTYNQQEKFFTQ